MKFYVYHLIDPRNGKTFYVGKGKGRRMYHHTKEALRGVYSRKCNLIREILSEGLEVMCLPIQRFDDEAEAYAFEADEVERIGLENLTNVLPGGGGVWVRPVKQAKWSADMLEKVAPRLARSMRELTAHGRLYMGDIDITSHVREVIQTILDEAGFDAVKAAVAPYGVELRQQF